MQIAANNNLVLTRLSSFGTIGGTYQAFKHQGLYQRIALAITKGARESRFCEAGDSLISVAAHALDLHQTEIVEQISEVLINAQPGREYQDIGRYYQAMCMLRRGEPSSARTILEPLAESQASPLRYRAQALKAIGATYYESSDYNEALRFYLQAIHAASPQHGRDLETATISQWMIAIIRGIHGDNKGALTALQRLSSPVRLVASDHPCLFYSYANSLAVEYGELGRIEEAQNASRIALASPFANIYSEFGDTSKDISQKARRASRSVVAISSKETLREDHTDEEILNEQTFITTDEQEGGPGNKLLLFRKRAFKSNKVPLYSHLQAKPNQLTLAQKRSRVTDIAYSLAEGDLDRLLELANELDDRPAQPRRPREINLEERGNLEMLISLWTTGDLNVDDHVAVLSALRDCDDNLRRKNIINLMISYMFRFTQERMEGEHFWRKRVEAQLTPETD